jgi:peptidoglycan/xylan/chitin deacetylase (PgdA/CDA1 family)
MLAGYQGRWPARLTPHLAELEREVQCATAQRSMTWAEIDQLGREAELHVGVHTLSHPVLPFLPDDEVRQEIAECFARISEQTRNPVPILAVPYGLGDARVTRLARASGMLGSLSLSGTPLRRATSSDWLPRICMSRGVPTWRLKLRLAGGIDSRWRQADGDVFPDLPSACT